MFSSPGWLSALSKARHPPAGTSMLCLQMTQSNIKLREDRSGEETSLLWEPHGARLAAGHSLESPWGRQQRDRKTLQSSQRQHAAPKGSLDRAQFLQWDEWPFSAALFLLTPHQQFHPQLGRAPPCSPTTPSSQHFSCRVKNMHMNFFRRGWKKEKKTCRKVCFWVLWNHTSTSDWGNQTDSLEQPLAWAVENIRTY